MQEKKHAIHDESVKVFETENVSTWEGLEPPLWWQTETKCANL